ncbi:MAG: hypothetical protein KIS92_23895 [Planctomycetota bacterium]|nr:hypothetical protein [Planctomycetota bacterium]
MHPTIRRGLAAFMTVGILFGLAACGGGGLPDATKTPAALTAEAYKVAGLCAFEIPKGWKIQPFKDLKHPIVAGTPTEQFAPNICVMDEKSFLGLKAYAESGLKELPKTLGPITNSSLTESATAEGRPAFRIAYDVVQEGDHLHFVQYCFHGKERKVIVVTFTRLVSQSTAMDAEFDTCMGTFRLVE